MRIRPIEDIMATVKREGLQRNLSAFDLVMMGTGAIIGTGIFVLTAVAANKAGPSMIFSFVIAAVVCALTALVYTELASMIPAAGSAYTYTYSTFGEVVAWLVGWALVLEYTVAAAAVAVGWSGYFTGTIMDSLLGIKLPPAITQGPPIDLSGAIMALGSIGVDVPPELINPKITQGVFNLPAAVLSLLVTWLLVMGTKASARFTAALVIVKILALTVFCVVALPYLDPENFNPVRADGASGFFPLGYTGMSAAAASIFFAYVGFDALSTAAEETKNPNKSIPIGLIGSFAICAVFYMFVAIAAVGAVGAQPEGALAQSPEPLAFVMKELGYETAGILVGLSAGFALPSVILMMLYGQTRVFFVMARDGLLPESLAKVHSKYKTPHVITITTGVFCALLAGFFPVGQLADLSNTGTLFAFLAVALGVMVLRVRLPDMKRTFRCPWIWIVGPLASIGCIYLFFSLYSITRLAFVVWGVIGLVIYVLYSRRSSHHGRALLGEKKISAQDR